MFRFRLNMDSDGICSRFEKSRQVVIGMLDHEMNVERKGGLFPHCRDHGRAKRNVIDEMAIHDVEMQPIGAGLFGPMDFVCEARKIGGQDGRSDQDFGMRHDRSRKENVSRTSYNSEALKRSEANAPALTVQRSSSSTFLPSFPLTRGESVSRYYPVSAGRYRARTHGAVKIEVRTRFRRTGASVFSDQSKG